MDQREDREEGVPPSKISLCGEHESRSKAQRNQPGPGPGPGPEPGSGPEPGPEPGPGPGPGPGPSCVSLKSDQSKEYVINFKGEQRSAVNRVHQKIDSLEPEPSCVSLKSDQSKEYVINFKGDQHSSSERVDQQSSEPPSGPSVQQHQTHLDSIFLLLEDNIVLFVMNELQKIKMGLSPDYPESLEHVLQGEDEEQRRRSSREAFVKITVNFLRRMKQEELAEHLQSSSFAVVCKKRLKSKLKKKSRCVSEGIVKAGNSTLLKQIYTELYITEGGTGEVNDEHEVRQIEAASRKPDRAETTIRQEDIFKLPPGRHEPIRTVMTKGVAGIGKTVLTQKFTLDWSEGRTNQDIQLLLPFTFRELNVLKERKFSLVELVQRTCSGFLSCQCKLHK